MSVVGWQPFGLNGRQVDVMLHRGITCWLWSLETWITNKALIYVSYSLLLLIWCSKMHKSVFCHEVRFDIAAAWYPLLITFYTYASCGWSDVIIRTNSYIRAHPNSKMMVFYNSLGFINLGHHHYFRREPDRYLFNLRQGEADLDSH